MGINEACWPMLEKLRLDGFFDKHGMPPWVFLIFLIAVILLAAFLMMPAGAKGTCGDGICQSGEASSCPRDCPASATSKDVKIDVMGGMGRTITLSLVSIDGTVIKSDTGKLVSLVIKGVTAEEVRGVVTNPATDESVESDVVRLVDGLNVITIGLSPGFAGGEGEDLPAGKGTIKVTVKDAASNQQIKANVGIFIWNAGSRIPVSSAEVSNIKYFILESGQNYQVVASAVGYNEYVRPPEKLNNGQEIDAVVVLTPMPPGPIPVANLTVCIREQDGTAISSGLVSIENAFAEIESNGHVASNGCAAFQLGANRAITALASGLPAGCLGTHSGEIILIPGSQNLDIRVSCNSSNIGSARLRVFGSNHTTLTQSAVITTWYSDNTQIYGSGYANALSVGEGGYTQNIQVSASRPFYVIVSNLTNYALFTSQNYTVGPSEYKSIDVTLIPTEFCGNNRRESPETCDGNDSVACPGQCIPAGQQDQCTCSALGPVCGNGVKESAEACDGNDDTSCPGMCTSSCTCPPVAPSRCGDDVKDGNEQCDGLDDFGCPGRCLTNCTCPPEELMCLGIPGDLNGDMLIDTDDLPYLSDIINTLGNNQVFIGLDEVFTCADVNGDGNVTEEDYLCLSAMLSGDATMRDAYCTSCMVAMQAYGVDRHGRYLRYGLEICHDGLDNDCDGQTDEDCQCDANQICDRRYDIDGITTTEDLAMCRSFGSTNFNTMQTTWGAYEWKDEAAQAAHECSSHGAESWGWTERCATPDWWASCLYKLPKGFSITDAQEDATGVYFGAVGFRANIGPLGVLENCGDCEGCPTDWFWVDAGRTGSCDCQNSTGSSCTEGTSGCSCETVCVTYCRYQYDPCVKYQGGVRVCGTSGGDGSEECAQKISCMGTLSDFP